MRNKKQGFTLIELLAVIVVLAIIALIAIPVILGVVDKAKVGAAKASALNYIDAVEKYLVISELDKTKTKIEPGVYEVSNGEELSLLDIFIPKVYAEDNTIYLNNIIPVKGDKPKKGWIKIGNKKVDDYSFIVKNYVVTKGEEITKGNEVAEMPSGIEVTKLNIGDVVYINPETAKLCTEIDYTNNTTASNTGNKTGCMKWYVYKDNGDGTHQFILDHNTTAVVAWISQTDYINTGGTSTDWTKGIRNNKGSITLKNQLKSDTSTWKESLNIRLIKADEVAQITGADKEPYNFNETTSTYDKSFYLDSNTKTQSSTCNNENITQCNYGWLYDRTKTTCTTNGCLNDADSSMTGSGYWLDSSVFGSNSSAWFLTFRGGLSVTDVGSINEGVRPVITF